MEFRDTEKQDGSLKIVFNEDEIKTLTKTKCLILDPKYSKEFVTTLMGVCMRLMAKLNPEKKLNKEK
jgi:hypothetical protein